ncbi:MAG: hypothetical protein J6X53_00155 [Abditibacteriota bacterium]|nr:hypothetical protein [Abditibacteriota bacterium]
MTIKDFLDLFTDPGILTVSLYDLNSDEGDDVWTGNGEEIPDEYADESVESVDAPSGKYQITINFCG